MKTLLPALLWLLALVPALAQAQTEVRRVPSFRTLHVSNGIELHLTAGEPQRVEVTAERAEDQARITTTVSDGVLRVGFEQDKSSWWGLGNNRHGRLRVYVTAAQLTGLKASSGAELIVKGNYPTGDLNLELSSGASLKGSFAASTMQAHLSSGSEAEVAGTTQRISVHTSSGSEFSGHRLQAAECQAETSSGASIAIAVQNTLTAHASSGGSVSYSGSPQVSKHTSSGGSVSGR